MVRARVQEAKVDHKEDLENLRTQAEVEKLYRDALRALYTIVLVHIGNPDEDVHVVDQLRREFPGSTENFWLGLMEMVAEEISDEGRVPDAGDG